MTHKMYRRVDPICHSSTKPSRQNEERVLCMRITGVATCNFNVSRQVLDVYTGTIPVVCYNMIKRSLN